MRPGARQKDPWSRLALRRHQKNQVEVCAYFSRMPASSNGGSAEHINSQDSNDVQMSKSDAHLEAQRNIQRHCKKIKFRCFKTCNKCKIDLGPFPDSSAELEKRSLNSSKSVIVSDVQLNDKDGNRLLTVEVLQTHKTEPTSRKGVDYVEVKAAVVNHTIEKAVFDHTILTNTPIILRCEVSNHTEASCNCNDLDEKPQAGGYTCEVCSKGMLERDEMASGTLNTCKACARAAQTGSKAGHVPQLTATGSGHTGTDFINDALGTAFTSQGQSNSGARKKATIGKVQLDIFMTKLDLSGKLRKATCDSFSKRE